MQNSRKSTRQMKKINYVESSDDEESIKRPKNAQASKRAAEQPLAVNKKIKAINSTQNNIVASTIDLPEVVCNDSVIDAVGLWDFQQMNDFKQPIDYFNFFVAFDAANQNIINKVVQATNKEMYGVINRNRFTIVELKQYIGSQI